MTEVEQIAAGLTEAQRIGLSEIYVNAIDFILFSPINGAAVSLREEGLIQGVGDATALSPLGLAVRAHLKDKAQ